MTLFANELLHLEFEVDTQVDSDLVMASDDYVYLLAALDIDTKLQQDEDFISDEALRMDVVLAGDYIAEDEVLDPDVDSNGNWCLD